MSEALATADRLFHHNEGLDVHEARRAIAPVLDPADDGELFLEYRESEVVSLDDGRIRNASFDSRRGFGLRSVTGEAAIYAHAGEISDAALARAVATLRDARPGGDSADPSRGRRARADTPHWASAVA